MTTLHIAHLYPDHMNLYGDRGNVRCLVNRCRWRGIDAQVTPLGPGDPFAPAAYDLVFIGGGPDREQARVAADLTGAKGDGLRRAVEDGVVVLAVCGGYQLLGRYYRPAVGDDLPGLGIFDLHTQHPGPKARRCIGNLVARIDDAETLVGFENHGGRTYLGPGCQRLARVVHGYGNNGTDGDEGAVYRNAFGTYLHGSLLPKNPIFTDRLLRLALTRHGQEARLTPLDDALEAHAHAAAIVLATQSKGFASGLLR